MFSRPLHSGQPERAYAVRRAPSRPRSSGDRGKIEANRSRSFSWAKQLCPTRQAVPSDVDPGESRVMVSGGRVRGLLVGDVLFRAIVSGGWLDLGVLTCEGWRPA